MLEKDVLCIILGGGRGTRLFPLTKDRAKPAVPLFGKYRLIDIPISNCLHSGFNRINVLTQFNSESLNKHIARTYKFDVFSQGFIDIIAADQTMDNTDWFEGSADAVRKSLKHFSDPRIKHVCILSGDQVYKMDLRKFFEYHLEKDADITVACNAIDDSAISDFGIIGVDENARMNSFVEKPTDKNAVEHMAVQEEGSSKFLCSMGIYFFKIETLIKVLKKNKKADFGKEIIPDSVQTEKIFVYNFKGYWRDIGTIKSFYAENLLLTSSLPPLDLFDENWPIFTRSRSLPPAKYQDSKIIQSLICDGSIVDSATVKDSIIGLRSRIGKASVIEDSIVIGADYYEPLENIKQNEALKRPSIGIGNHCVIKKAILDKNARIGDQVKIVNEKKLKDFTADNYMIKDGITIVYKNATIPSGTVI
ncbi:MAG: glucose-1-phosphate adenylyltransferase [Candidatus Omnitrophota bacterium]